jgi:hypothetical protein
MTKEQALQAMIDGEKVTHRYFSSDEYIYMVAQNIFTEDGFDCGTVNQAFWRQRDGENWETGWSLYEGN